MKKKAIVFLLSDFMEDYQHNLKIASGKHDITGIRVYDKYEAEIPNLGMVQVQDQETGASVFLSTPPPNRFVGTTRQAIKPQR